MSEHGPEEGVRIACMQVGRMTLGIDILRIVEVLSPRPLLDAELEAAAVSKLLMLRGQLLPVVDLARLINPKQDPGADGGRLAVVVIDDVQLVLQVDRMAEVVTVKKKALIALPPRRRAALSPLICGAALRAGGDLLLLDLRAVVEHVGLRVPETGLGRPVTGPSQPHEKTR